MDDKTARLVESAKSKKRNIILARCRINDDCPICLDNMKNKRCYITKCGHIFHSKCLKNWCEKSIFESSEELTLNQPKNNCPICKQNIIEEIEIHLHLNIIIEYPSGSRVHRYFRIF